EAVASGRTEKAQAALAAFREPAPVISAAELASRCDIIVDCAPTSAFCAIAEPALRAGKVLVTVSGAALLQHPEIIDLARAHGGRIILATGALLGLDAVRAAAESVIHSVTMVTHKPPKSLNG